MFDSKKFDVSKSTVQGIDGKSSQTTIEIQKKPEAEWQIGNPFKMAEMIRKIDPADPHYVLKVANLFKAFEHSVKGDENGAALWRTQHFSKIEEFREFFEQRTGHSKTAEEWFKSKENGYRLKHFYQGFHATAPKECTPVAMPGGEYPYECHCWIIEGAYRG
jgi:hypothetical protein